MCNLFGGGGDSNVTQTQKFEPPAYTQQGWQDYLNRAQQETQGPAPVYGGPTVAPWNMTQQSAADMLYNMVTGGTPAYNAAQGQIAYQAMGGAANPYATTTNPFMGDNQYLQALLNSQAADITKAYGQGTAAQTDAAAARAGAYGGSGYDERVQANQRSLADALAQNEANLRMQNYNQSAQLGESALNRATSAYQNQQQNALQAAGLGMQTQGVDLNAINALMNLGNAQQGYQQNILNAGQNMFGQFAQAPFVYQDILGNALSRASGSGGTNSTSITQPGYSVLPNLLGAGLIGSSLFGGG